MCSSHVNLSLVNERTDSDNVSCSLASRITDSVNQYVPMILTISGTVCNVIVVMVMYSKFFRKNSSSLYIAVNAVVDIGSLTLLLPPHWVYMTFPEVFTKTLHSHALCRFFNFAGWGTSDLGILLTVAMTTERAIAVMLPLRANSLCTRRRAKVGITIVTVIIVIKEIQFLITSRMVSVPDSLYLCTVTLENPVYAVFWTKYWLWIHNVFLLASFLIISASNVVILKSVKRSDTQFGAGGQKSARHQSRNRQLSLMLLIDSVTVVVFTLPYSIIVSLSQFGEKPRDEDVDKLINSVAFYLLYVNRCANFYLYCVSGSRFRQVLKQILCRRCSGMHGRSSGSALASYSSQFTTSSPTAINTVSGTVSMNPAGLS